MQSCLGHGRDAKPIAVREDWSEFNNDDTTAPLAPAVYGLDDEGKSVVIVNPVPPELVNEAEEGAQACPEHAITVRYHD